jgi:hypothetical protein
VKLLDQYIPTATLKNWMYRGLNVACNVSLACATRQREPPNHPNASIPRYAFNLKAV